MRLDKRHWLLLSGMAVAFFLYYKMQPVEVDPIIKATASRNRGNITNIDTSRNIIAKETFFVDVLDFESSNILTHATLGPLDLGGDYFIDFEGRFEVHQEGTYLFFIESDDGFRLTVDEKLVAQFLQDRPMGLTTGNMFLKQGTHTFALSFFQGFGNVGLVARYKLKGEERKFLIGESSEWITFRDFENR